MNPAIKAVAVYFSLNIELFDNQCNFETLSIPVLPLSGLLMAVWSSQLWLGNILAVADTFFVDTAAYLNDLVAKVTAISTLVGIGCRALAWGTFL